ncbi:MAG: HlyD family efflux transporter periplasmic adaptor subunit [Thiobacillaceae bacterium]|nr:HlyD family efflux transporter periplasmic adaptor subunit [Thiobacillaceae bacterium]MCX7672590.1 HlyD family efflux transporter periplasmic adaptor subunit [Thiobacillaceae bacterium]MDW8322530.1 HlyD family efflux transporter periplasmic adaptor subunit [Burkholderiales bacterium]
MTRSRLLLFALLLVLAGALSWGFMPRPIAVEIVEVRRGPLTVTIEDEGRTRIRDRYVVSAPVAGSLHRIRLKAGDAVQRGQAVAELEPLPVQALDARARAQAAAQVRAAQAQLEAAREQARAARAELELAQAELGRTEALARADFLSRAAVDQARARFERAQAAHAAATQTVEVARHQLEQARIAYRSIATLPASTAAERLVLRAPVAGRVLRLMRESEGVVAAGQPLMELGDPQALEVEVEVLSTQAVRIRPGGRVVLERWGGPPLEGRVRVVEPQGFTKVSALGVEEQRVRVLVDLVSPPEQWRALGDGFRVEARFVVWEGADVLQVPASSLFRLDGGWALYAVQDGRARLRRVQVGEWAGPSVQITAGVEPGERVIAQPDERLREGVRVRGRS